MPGLLDLVAVADNFPYQESPADTQGELWLPFHLTRQDFDIGLPPLGLLRPGVMDEIRKDCCNKVDSEPTTDKPFDLLTTKNETEAPTEIAVCAASTVQQHNFGQILTGVIEGWKSQGLFPRQLDDPTNEQCDVHVDPRSSFQPSMIPPVSGKGLSFPFSRDACALFGFKAHAVHMTAYEGTGDDMKIWVPQRSALKLTWPGYLDNTVGGGISAGQSPEQAIKREAEEEANFSGDYVEKYIQATGLVSFLMRTDDGGLCPQVIYTYDMKLSERSDPGYQQPKPNDGEVDWFKLLPVSEVISALENEQFRPPAAVVLIDFLFRHRFIRPDKEPQYHELVYRLRRDLDKSMTFAAGKSL